MLGNIIFVEIHPILPLVGRKNENKEISIKWKKEIVNSVLAAFIPPGISALHYKTSRTHFTELS